MKTPTRTEGSATFSLGELMKLEDERIAEQKRDRETQAKAAADAKLAAETKAKADADAAEATKRRAELDDLARREAMQKALVEQARLEVDARTRADERERERLHEIELANARSTPVPPKSTGLGQLVGATAFGGALMLIVTLAIHFGVEKPATDRRITELELREGIADQRATNAEQKIEQQQRTIAGLEKSKAALEAQLATPVPSDPVAKKPTTPNRPTTTTKKPDQKQAPCDPHDPMCF